MILNIIIEGLILSTMLVLFCAFGIRDGAVNMVYLYHQDVQDRCVRNGLITGERVRRNQTLFKGIGIPFYFIFVLVSVYAVNKTKDFWLFLQMFAILSIANLADRLLIDEYWVGHTNAWVIPGTEDLKPYINRKDKLQKWLFGTIGFAMICAVLSGIMSLVLK